MMRETLTAKVAVPWIIGTSPDWAPDKVFTSTV